MQLSAERQAHWDGSLLAPSTICRESAVLPQEYTVVDPLQAFGGAARDVRRKTFGGAVDVRRWKHYWRQDLRSICQKGAVATRATKNMR